MSDNRNVKIRVRNLSKVFGSQPKKALELRDQGLKRPEILDKTGQTLGLSNIDFDVHEGELLVIMGLSGSGKSTLIRCLNRLIEPSEGEIVIDGENIPDLKDKALLECRRRHFSMVFQNFALFPNRTVRQNAEFGLEVRGVAPDERREAADKSLKQVGLDGWEDAYPNQLSGGMQQRVGLARALANDATVLLMDEAFSALDPLIRGDMQQELLALQHRMQKTTVFITHDLDEALTIGDRIVLLKDGEVVQIGTPEEILTQPADDYVRRFIEGVDKSRILTAESAMRRVRSTVRDSDGPRTALKKMREHSLDSIYILDRERRLVGLIDAESASQAHEKGKERVTEAMTQDFRSVKRDEPLHNLFAMFHDNHFPIAVVDDRQQLQGVVVKGAVLDELAQAGEA
ncbi:glycine betaine/L-proline ABC transporter ATP-binding protein [Halomonas sp. 18H]|uniref:quaternary amine ABC transporter ATP-binding protein n=1 Tax=Halomonas almeriensis TaxID=308163 RepID=UPI002231CD29|nr:MULTISPECIES: glycine betaine/L-proline ABC transporter ATP-binding protein [Halomonas]MCW4149332.1 glycine betaine/L-proline ABC transporter ATP-binding protein [Halomonas sp. 18H]MDN3553722.1 glycine betaine/L-proline ABC transporter ATP-binding protein [Halomonas almeriensis]